MDELFAARAQDLDARFANVDKEIEAPASLRRPREPGAESALTRWCYRATRCNRL